MTSEPADREAYERARSHVRAIRGFYVHAAVYCIVIGALFLLDLATRGRWWFFWPGIGWGIGLGVHAVAVFGLGDWLGRDWEQRKIREVMEKDRGA